MDLMTGQTISNSRKKNSILLEQGESKYTGNEE
jgi:hypothetical protein